jgi:hypothetical protein
VAAFHRLFAAGQFTPSAADDLLETLVEPAAP